MENFQEHPQGILLTQSIWPVLNELHPDGQFCVGQNAGIYWTLTDPPLKGAKAPDWFYVPNVPPMLDGQSRRSYIMWKEIKSPLVVIEFVSGDGTEERDRTPREGKFWVYEQAIRVPYYFIFDGFRDTLDAFHLNDLIYEKLAPNERGHYPIPSMKVEVGIRHGTYLGTDGPWLRFFDLDGKLLLAGDERAEQYAAKLRELGVDPEQL